MTKMSNLVGSRSTLAENGLALYLVEIRLTESGVAFTILCEVMLWQ